MAVSGYLPPVVIQVLGDDAQFLKTITRDEAALKGFEKKPAVKRVKADNTQLIDAIEQAKAMLAQFAAKLYESRLGLDAAPFWAAYDALRAKVAADPATMKVQADVAPALAAIEALRTSLGAAQGGGFAVDSGGAASRLGSFLPVLYGRDGYSGSTLPDVVHGGNRLPVLWTGGMAAGEAGSAGGSGGRGFLGGLGSMLGGLFAGGAGGGGGGILSALGFGSSGSKGIGGIGAGMASFGSIGSLLGLGAEHLLTTMLGVGGSAVGGMVGGGLLGMGALGAGAVGMGTDMAGIGQASHDIQLVVKAQNQLRTAQQNANYMMATYGKNSAAAAAAIQQVQLAQANLNTTLGSFSPVARAAVLAAANTAQAFEKMFDNVTGPAEKVGAQILQQAMKVGMAFLPTIGKYAAENMGIIKRDIQPLFSWLTSMKGGTGKGFLSNLMGGGKVGGLAIFTNLEQVFQKNLPTAIKALSEGFKFFAKTVDVAAQQTGKFISRVAQFFTHMNSPAAFSSWAKEVDKLIGLFRTWLHFLVAVGKTVYDVFKPAVGAGQALIKMLTSALGVLDKWLTKASNTKALHNLFSAHLVELVKGFGKAIGAAIPLLLSFGKGFLPVLTVGAKIGTLVLQPLIAGLRLLSKIPFSSTLLGWAGSMFLLSKAVGGLKLTNLSTLFSGLIGGIGSAVKWLQMLPTTIGVALIKVQEFGATLLRGGAQAVQWAGSMIASGARFAAQFVAQLARSLAAAAVWTAEHAAMAASFIAENVAMAASATAAFIAENIATLGIAAAIALLIAGIIYAATHWKQVWGAMKDAAIAVADAIKATVAALGASLATAWGAIESAAVAVWNALKGAASATWNAIRSDAVAVWDAIRAAWDALWGSVEAAGRAAWAAISGGATRLWHALDSIWHAIEGGATSVWDAIVAFIRGVPGRIVGGFSSLGTDLHNVATTAWDLFLAGVRLITGDVVTFVRGIPHMILSALGNLGSLLFNAGKMVIQGLINGITSMAGGVVGAIGKIAGSIGHHITSFFHIGSPSRLMMEYGQFIGQGLALGITNSQGLVDQAAGLLAKTAAAPLSPDVMGSVGRAGVTGGPGGALGGSGMNVYIQQAPITINGAGNPGQAVGLFKRAQEQANQDLIARLRAGTAY